MEATNYRLEPDACQYPDRHAVVRENQVIDVLKILKPLSTQCTLNTAIAFLTIAARPGVTVGDVQKILGMRPTSTCRALSMLYEHARGTAGLDLVESRGSPKDLRIKHLYLTPKGMRIWRQIERLLSH